MTVAEARRLLAKLPDALPLCFALSDYSGIIVEIGKIDLVPVTVEGDAYMATFDDAADGAARVAVVS